MAKRRLLVRETRWYGWRPDLPDARDLMFAPRPQVIGALPPRVDLRPYMPSVYDQGNLGSCTANAIGAALQFTQIKQREADFVPSRLFIYYNERVMEDSVNSDAGAEIRDGMKAVNKLGAPPEKLWPYIISKFKRKPPAAAFKAALAHQSISYQRVPRDLNHMRACLAEGFPYVFGFSVYDGFESDACARTGVLNVPGKDEQVLGGHAVLAVGYDDASRRFYVRNSWGDAWGQKGYFTMPYEYMANRGLCSDFWTVRQVE
ncbi:MAG TPA: C1 family peptidase [Methylomirabilota bacterium]|jgi:C1A family cysteine protease|nr:C1 family peptidase [Methylomirabilota bacterium]